MDNCQLDIHKSFAATRSNNSCEYRRFQSQPRVCPTGEKTSAQSPPFVVRLPRRRTAVAYGAGGGRRNQASKAPRNQSDSAALEDDPITVSTDSSESTLT